ncbi:MAG: MBL fold metallo-hydrolase [Chloroflexota bacterium]
MPEIDVLAQGMGISSNETRLSLCAVTLIRGEQNTLVDVGYQGRRILLVERLAERGLALTDIDRVVLTHGHWDHTLNALMFPNAEIIMSADEYEYVQHISPLDPATPLYTPDILAKAKRFTTVRDGEELESGVRVMMVPGHSPGSLAVLVETADGIAGMVGDALPSMNAAKADVPTAGQVFFDEEIAEQSARRILDTCQLVYPGHDRAFRVKSGGFQYIEPQSITFGNLPRDEHGKIAVTLDETPGVFRSRVEPTAKRRA